MLTIRAKIKGNFISFLDKVDLPEDIEKEVLVTFLDKDISLFEDLGERDAMKIVNAVRFNLTDKELEILRLAEQGMTNDQIADQLEISHGTARNYLSGIYEKLKVSNRTGAISKAKELGLLN